MGETGTGHVWQGHGLSCSTVLSLGCPSQLFHKGNLPVMQSYCPDGTEIGQARQGDLGTLCLCWLCAAQGYRQAKSSSLQMSWERRVAQPLRVPSFPVPGGTSATGWSHWPVAGSATLIVNAWIRSPCLSCPEVHVKLRAPPMSTSVSYQDTPDGTMRRWLL